MTNIEFLQPVLALILWTLFIGLWMYATRIPAMTKAGIDPQEAAQPGSGDWRLKIPASVHWKADNYNHLHEQPTLFYALMAFIVLTGGGDFIALYLAWGYVALRVVHSLIQVTVNRVMARFAVFFLSNIVLIILSGKEAIRVFL